MELTSEASGSAIRLSGSISPWWWVPISITAYRWRLLSRSRFCGTPIWLLVFPSV